MVIVHLSEMVGSLMPARFDLHQGALELSWEEKRWEVLVEVVKLVCLLSVWVARAALRASALRSQKLSEVIGVVVAAGQTEDVMRLIQP